MTTSLQPGQVKFDAGKLLRPSLAFFDFIQHLMWTQPGAERRKGNRFGIAIPAVAVAMDEQLEPAGPQFVSVVRSMSMHGLAIHHSCALECKYIALELALPGYEKIQVLVEVHRCQPIGAAYEIAGTFVRNSNYQSR